MRETFFLYKERTGPPLVQQYDSALLFNSSGILIDSPFKKHPKKKFRSIAGHWDLHRAGTPLYLTEVISSPTKETAKIEGKIAEWYSETVCALNDTANYMGYKVSS